MFHQLRKVLAGVAALAALALGGAAIADAAGSHSTSTASTTTSSASGSSTARPAFPAHGTAAHEDAEKAVTGTAADKAKAAAVKSVGSGTAGDVSTDYTGDGYEVTVTKSDGSKVDVHLTGSFTVMDGPGDHGGPGMHGGPPPGGAAGAPSGAPSGYGA